MAKIAVLANDNTLQIFTTGSGGWVGKTITYPGIGATYYDSIDYISETDAFVATKNNSRSITYSTDNGGTWSFVEIPPAYARIKAIIPIGDTSSFLVIPVDSDVNLPTKKYTLIGGVLVDTDIDPFRFSVDARAIICTPIGMVIALSPNIDPVDSKYHIVYVNKQNVVRNIATTNKPITCSVLPSNKSDIRSDVGIYFDGVPDYVLYKAEFDSQSQFDIIFYFSPWGLPAGFIPAYSVSSKKFFPPNDNIIGSVLLSNDFKTGKATVSLFSFTSVTLPYAVTKLKMDGITTTGITAWDNGQKIIYGFFSHNTFGSQTATFYSESLPNSKVYVDLAVLDKILAPPELTATSQSSAFVSKLIGHMKTYISSGLVMSISSASKLIGHMKTYISSGLVMSISSALQNKLWNRKVTAVSISSARQNKSWHRKVTAVVVSSVSGIASHLRKKIVSALVATYSKLQKTHMCNKLSQSMSISDRITKIYRKLIASTTADTFTYLTKSINKNISTIVSVPLVLVKNMIKKLAVVILGNTSKVSSKFWAKAWSFLYNNKWIGVKHLSNIGATSTDGSVWTPTTLPITGVWSGLTNLGSVNVAVSRDGKVIKSNDGVSWSEQNTPIVGQWMSIVAGNGVFVGVGLATDKCIRSTDGTTWTEQTLPLLSSWTSIAHNGTLFCAVSGDGKCATSLDGLSWTERTMPDQIQYNCVTWALNQFTAVASGPTNLAAKSTDGINWTRIYMPQVANWKAIGPGIGDPNV